MKHFFGAMFGALAGSVLAGIIFGLLVIGGIAALFSGGGDSKSDKVKEKTVLHLEMKHVISDRPSENPFDNIDFMSGESNKTMALSDLLMALQAASEDDKVAGVFLDLSDLSVSMSSLEDIRAALNSFKEKEKFVYAYSESYSQASYYLASSANKIYLHPMGDFLLKGLGAEMMFFKGVLDKIGVEPIAIRPEGNKFKSAVEPFLLSKASSENRAQMQQILNDYWRNMLQVYANRTGLTVGKIQTLADNLHVTQAFEAFDFGFVDSLLYRDEVMERMADAAGWEDAESDDNPLMTLPQYLKGVQSKENIRNKKEKSHIAVLFAEGEIVRGKGGDGTVASDDFAAVLEEIRKDDKIKALVLRVNSPGGDALASEIIWRGIMRVKEKKPVVVSMGSLAASGGYYIACAADSIFASPYTLTGSIGVFGIMFNAQRLLNEKLGVTIDTVLTARSADFPTGSRPMSEIESAALQRSVNKVYEDFTGRVAAGRNLPIERVADSIGQGRVWTGNQAIELGLVDAIGSLKDAIACAAGLAGLENHGISYYPSPSNPFETFLLSLSEDAKLKLAGMNLQELYLAFQQMKYLNKSHGVRAELPYGFKLIY